MFARDRAKLGNGHDVVVSLDLPLGKGLAAFLELTDGLLSYANACPSQMHLGTLAGPGLQCGESLH